MSAKRKRSKKADKRPKPKSPRIEAPDEQDLEKLKAALEENLYDVDVNRAYARALMIRGQFEEALQCWYRIEETTPDDPKAARMIAKLIISQTRRNAGKPSSAQSASTEPDAQKRADVGESNDRIGSIFYRSNQPQPTLQRRQIELTEWQKLQRAVDEIPGDVQRVLQLVDYYLDQDRHFDAERVLKKALSVADDDPQLREQWEQIRLSRFEKKVRTARQRTSVENTPAAQHDLQQAQEEYRQLVLELCGLRCEQDPKNPLLKLDLARRLQDAGDIPEALAWFERVSKDPERRAIATLHMGQCLQLLDRMPEALRHYRHAVELTGGGLTSGGELRSGCRPQALYQAAVLAMQMHLTEPAREYLTELVQLESEYQDSASQLLQQLTDY